MSFDSLLPLINKTGSSLSPADFHRAVNVVFHDAEAPLLDIGCGTGLSTQLLLSSKLGANIQKVTLADTSPKMIEIAEARAREWNVDHELLNNEIADITGKYDIILICSVLHHIPDLQEFLKHVSRLQNVGGIIIHLQDPNGDAFENADYHSRISEFDEVGKTKVNRSPFKSIKKKIKRLIGKKDYIDQVNDELLKRNAIRSRMTAEEIWSVTDIHVEDLPFSTGKGISLEAIGTYLPEYTQLGRRSYGFFGPLKSELPAEFQSQEEKLIGENQLNGRHIAAVWQKLS